MAFGFNKKKKQDLSEGEIDDENEEEIEEEQEDEIVQIKRAVGKNTETQNLQQRKRELEQSDRFSAFHNPERVGIIDNMSGQPVTVDNIWGVLAEILNKLDRIEKSL